MDNVGRYRDPGCTMFQEDNAVAMCTLTVEAAFVTESCMIAIVASSPISSMASSGIRVTRAGAVTRVTDNIPSSICVCTTGRD